MSHFPVVIFGKNIAKQLGPYVESYNSEKERDKYFKVKVWSNQEEHLFDTEKQAKEAIQNGLVPDYPEEPYYWTNPNKKWDYWIIGGRWSQFFKAKEGCSGEIQLRTTFDGRTISPDKEGWFDKIKKGDIDFDGMNQATLKLKLSYYDRVHFVLEGTPIPNQWIYYKDQSDIKLAREQYWSQPGMKLLKEANPDVGDFDQYLISREDYIKQYEKAGSTPFAFVKDGVWHSKGEMGWFGISHNNQDELVWQKQFSDAVDSVTDSTLLTIVDCHI